MIEQVSGQLVQKSPTFCVIDCHGIGIGLFISVNTFQKLGEETAAVQLLTHLQVREDALQLYGFQNAEEREMFRQLLSVGGIGPRLALTILSGLTVEELVHAIATENHQLLVKIPGVGKKTAQRVVLELKEKVKVKAGTAETGEFAALNETARSRAEEAILALMTLGYRQPEARKAVEKILGRNGEIALDELIKLALKEV